MRAGLLRHLVTLQQRTAGTDAFGGPARTWQDFATVYADIEPLNGRELFAAQAVQSAVTHKITTRFIPSVAVLRPADAAALRLVYGERVFNIIAVMNIDERDREFTLLAAEGLTQE